MVTDKIVIPLLKALITGVLVSLAASSWFIAAIPWKLFFIVLSGSALLSWLMIITPKMRSGLRISNNTNSSSHFPQTTKVEIIATDPAGAFSSGRFADLKVHTHGLIAVAKRIEAGSSFSYAGLAGPGRPLSRAQFEVLRDEFISRGLAYWVNPGSHAQGCELTKAGRAVIRHFSNWGNSPSKPIPQLKNGNSTVTVPPKPVHARERTREEVNIDN